MYIGTHDHAAALFRYYWVWGFRETSGAAGGIRFIAVRRLNLCVSVLRHSIVAVFWSKGTQ